MNEQQLKHDILADLRKALQNLLIISELRGVSDRHMGVYDNALFAVQAAVDDFEALERPIERDPRYRTGD